MEGMSPGSSSRLGARNAASCGGRVVAALVLLAVAVNVSAERLPLRSYTMLDGLAQDKVKFIARDSRGFLWFCTTEGLSRFDGTRFVTFTEAHGLPFPSINEFL